MSLIELGFDRAWFENSFELEFQGQALFYYYFLTIILSTF